MSFPSTTKTIYIQMTQDILLIHNEDFLRETAYMVKNKDDQTVRKGRFTGKSVQLSLSHLPSGRYSLGVNHDDEVVTYHFEKY
jgi:Domain of unknown function (DUF3244)